MSLTIFDKRPKWPRGRRPAGGWNGYGAMPSPGRARGRRRLGLRDTYGFLALGCLALAAVFWQQGAAALPSFALSGSGEQISRTFPLCGPGPRPNCIVDGDTLWIGGEKIRIADINTPEVSSPGCREEALLGARATARLQQLVNSGPFELKRGLRDEDVYGRKLRTLSRNGKSLGQVLVTEGLAESWVGFRRNWCA